MYKLYTDKIEKFSAKIRLEGASLKDSKARLVIESESFDLMFKGTIDTDGVVNIPVKRLRGLIDENTTGNIKLEIIAEDTYFVPWESTFEVETSKKVTVEIKSQSSKVIKESKSSVEIVSQSEPTITERQHVLNIVKLLIKEDINIKNISFKRNKLGKIVATYLKENTVKNNKEVIRGVLKRLEKTK